MTTKFSWAMVSSARGPPRALRTAAIAAVAGVLAGPGSMPQLFRCGQSRPCRSLPRPRRARLPRGTIARIRWRRRHRVCPGPGWGDGGRRGRYASPVELGVGQQAQEPRSAFGPKLGQIRAQVAAPIPLPGAQGDTESARLDEVRFNPVHSQGQLGFDGLRGLPKRRDYRCPPLHHMDARPWILFRFRATPMPLSADDSHRGFSPDRCAAPLGADASRSQARKSANVAGACGADEPDRPR